MPTRWVKLQCPGMGVRIRTGPAQDQPEVRVAAHGEELEVLITTVKGFYQLADGTVRIQLLLIATSTSLSQRLRRAT